MINFFELVDDNRLVDLPGYGFAKVKDAMREHWELLIGTYLETRKALKGIVLINDIRHPLKDSDWQMIEWSQHYQLPLLLVLNKADKLTRNHANQAIQFVQKETRDFDVDILATSSMKRTGLEEVRAWILERLSID